MSDEPMAMDEWWAYFAPGNTEGREITLSLPAPVAHTLANPNDPMMDWAQAELILMVKLREQLAALRETA